MPAEKQELRQLVSTPLLEALDAIALSEGTSRTVFIEKLLEERVMKDLHKASVLLRAMRGNPLLSEINGAVGD